MSGPYPTPNAPHRADRVSMAAQSTPPRATHPNGNQHHTCLHRLVCRSREEPILVRRKAPDRALVANKSALALEAWEHVQAHLCKHRHLSQRRAGRAAQPSQQLTVAHAAKLRLNHVQVPLKAHEHVRPEPVVRRSRAPAIRSPCSELHQSACGAIPPTGERRLLATELQRGSRWRGRPTGGGGEQQRCHSRTHRRRCR